jgi:hypothetical protein
VVLLTRKEPKLAYSNRIKGANADSPFAQRYLLMAGLGNLTKGQTSLKD